MCPVPLCVGCNPWLLESVHSNAGCQHIPFHPQHQLPPEPGAGGMTGSSLRPRKRALPRSKGNGLCAGGVCARLQLRYRMLEPLIPQCVNQPARCRHGLLRRAALPAPGSVLGAVLRGALFRTGQTHRRLRALCWGPAPAIAPSPPLTALAWCVKLHPRGAARPLINSTLMSAMRLCWEGSAGLRFSRPSLRGSPSRRPQAHAGLGWWKGRCRPR